jgi:hypothetical protein
MDQQLGSCGSADLQQSHKGVHAVITVSRAAGLQHTAAWQERNPGVPEIRSHAVRGRVGQVVTSQPTTLTQLTQC